MNSIPGTMVKVSRLAAMSSPSTSSNRTSFHEKKTLSRRRIPNFPSAAARIVMGTGISTMVELVEVSGDSSMAVSTKSPRPRESVSESWAPVNGAKNPDRPTRTTNVIVRIECSRPQVKVWRFRPVMVILSLTRRKMMPLLESTGRITRFH